MAGSGWDIIARSLGRVARDVLRSATGSRSSSTRRSQQTRRERNAPPLSYRYPGDYRGRVSITYDPHPGKLADPGEVAWTWVPYEEDHSQGKDRPVLIIGRDGDWLLALPLTSKDHDRDADQEASEDRFWIDVGTGDWDRSGRPSEARINRIVRVNPEDVRRVGGKLSKARFDKVAAAVRKTFNN